jgi:putative methionine-R-sulfoxide reductase with GAF domain
MSENFFIGSSLDKKSKYENLLSQLPALIANEPDLIANLANLSAIFHQLLNGGGWFLSC